MKFYFTILGLLLSVATISAAKNDAPLTFFAPAAAPVNIDSLPTGRHKVSSYRNGSSIEVVVEDQEIKSLKIDGEDVAASAYDQYQDRVEELLGTNEKGSQMRIYRYSNEEGLDGLEERLEGMGESFEGMGEMFEKMGEKFEFRFEGMGEDLEKMGERLGEQIEQMFNLESDGNVMRFEFRGDGDWNMDSLSNSQSFEWHSDGMHTDPKGLNPDMPASERSQAEAEIREMETMIEQMERQKVRMKANLERQERNASRQERNASRQEYDASRQERDASRQELDGSRQERDAARLERDAFRQNQGISKMERTESRQEDLERREASYEVLINQLQREGLLEDTGRLRKLAVDGSSLKVNGKKASKEGYERFLELYEQQTGKKFNSNTSISVKMD